MFKTIFKISIVAALIFTTLACGRKETPPQPKEQEDPTVTAVATLFKKWDQAFNTKDPDKLMEIIPDEIKERQPEEAKNIVLRNRKPSQLVELKDVNMNTSVDRIVMDNNEETKATVYVTQSATDLKTRKAIDPLKDHIRIPSSKKPGNGNLISRGGQRPGNRKRPTKPARC